MKNLARFGCLARSLVYFLVGILALLVAMGNPYGTTTDESGVMRKILEQPFGRIILFIVAVGLFCYSVWRIFQSIHDHDKYGRGIGGMSVRAGFLFSGLAYAFLGVYSLNLVFAWTKNTAFGERMMAKWMMMQPFGRAALFALGISVVIVGFFQFVRAFDGSFKRDLRLPRRWLTVVCRFGLVSRGIVFVIIGSFFMQAAWKYRSREAGGLKKAWETLQERPYGNYLVGAVAVGFMAFAIFGLIEGFYRKRSS